MELTNTTTIIIVVVVLLIVGILLSMAFRRAQRTRRLKERFGTEYERVADRLGDKRQAEEELESRLARADALNLRALSADEVNQFALDWQAIQTEFVDQPLGAVQKASRLVEEVMSLKGYPQLDFEQRAADISVEYPELVSNYRELHASASKGDRERMSTEEMRQAMVHGRELFEHLVQPGANAETRTQKERI